MRRRFALSASILLLAACTEPGRDPVPVDASAMDTGAPDAGAKPPSDAGAPMPDTGTAMPDAGTTAPDAGDEPDAGEIPCEAAPASPATVSEDVVFCEGVQSIGVDGAAAIRVTAPGVTVTCLGTRFASTAGTGTTEEPTIGFLVDGVDDVSIVGCGASGFRYGLVARSASRLTVDGADFSDNFTDPSAGWVQDSVQGGGIRLDDAHDSVVQNSSFARNWNGIELRRSTGNEVRSNVADHCSNTGATLADAHDNRLEANDFSWGIRGDQLAYPDNWYGIDTRDSAGIIIDAGSSGNEIVGNDTTYGGDGIFIRSIIGGCATDNLIEGNDTSFSPHNAIECWCDGNRFIGNTASDSHYGLWLGGTDEAVVRGNLVERNVVDGISIQIGENRHTLIEDNTITDNGRVGVLITGREVQAWHALDRVGPNLANSSHVVVQHNTIARNGPCLPYDTDCGVFAASTRGLMMASNCDDAGGEVTVTAGSEAEGLWSAGGCGASAGGPPVARLADVSASASAPVTLSATLSSDPDQDPLGYHWLVQRAGTRFVPAVMPELGLLYAGTAEVTFSFPGPGLWDVAVTVDDGASASMAWTTAAVIPSAVEIGGAAADWSYACTEPACVTMITDDASAAVSGPTSVQVATDEPFDFAAYTPPGRSAGWDASGATRLAGFFRAENQNPFGWQGEFPTFVIGSAAGTITLKPDANLLPAERGDWIYVDAPLAGGEGWTRTEAGNPTLADVDFVEIHTDTWDFGTYYVWIDGLGFY